MVNASDRFGKHRTNLQDLQLRTSLLMLFLVDTIGHDNFVKCTSIYPVDGFTTEDAVGDERVDLLGAFLSQ